MNHAAAGRIHRLITDAPLTANEIAKKLLMKREDVLECLEWLNAQEMIDGPLTIKKGNNLVRTWSATWRV